MLAQWEGEEGQVAGKKGDLCFNPVTPHSGGSLFPEQVGNTPSPFPWNPCQSTSNYASFGS